MPADVPAACRADCQPKQSSRPSSLPDEQTDPLSLPFNRDNGGDRQARGRSRGCFSSKIVGVWSEHAREGLADLACDAAEFRLTARAMAATPVLPSRKNASNHSPARPISTVIAT